MKESGVFTFVFLDGKIMRVVADSCKHYSGHAVLTNALLSYSDVELPWYKKETVYPRLNIGLYGLRYMIPDTGDEK